MIPKRAPDVVVIGAGVVGCAIARRLDDELSSASVVVLDPRGPGAEASAAAAGMLTPQYESGGRGPFFRLCHSARLAFPDFVRGLSAETGIDPKLRRDGMIWIALDEGEERVLAEARAWQVEAGLAARSVSPGELETLEPLASSEATAGLLLPDDIQVDNVELCRALGSALEDRGRIETRYGASAARVTTRGASVSGVLLEDGEAISCRHVVIAAGAWSGGIAGLPRDLPVRPVRGQMLELRAGSATPTRILASMRAYIVPRDDGRSLVGSTLEEVGFARGPSIGGMREIIENAVELAPALRGSQVTGCWAGLRPATPDGLPYLGEDPEVSGLYYATGHYRNGILLAWETARIIAALIAGEKPAHDIAPFAVNRGGGSDGSTS